MSAIKGILWDNDGVLVDSERIFFEANRDYFRHHGIELSEDDFFAWFLAEDRGAWHLLEAQGMSQDEVAACRCRRNDLYAQRLRAADGLLHPTLADLLARLHGRVAMGIVTSSSREHFDVIHRPLGLLRYFDFVLTAETYVNAKPSPEPYLLGLQKLGLAADACIAVEDAPRGLAAAQAAGLRCIVLRTALTRRCDFAGAACIVESLTELAAAIEALL